MVEAAKPLSNVHVIEELVQLPVGSDTVVIANSYWTKNLNNVHVIEKLEQLPVGSDTIVIVNSYWTKNLALGSCIGA